MRKKQTQKYSELSWEEAVAKYLEENPDFFSQHADLLEKLSIPHLENDGAVSLIERQVRVLRDKNRTQQQQLRDLIQIARENETLGDRIHHFTLALADAGSLDDVLGTVQGTLREDFKLDATTLLIKPRGRDARGRPEFVSATDKCFSALLARIGTTKAVCDNTLDATLLDYLFNRHGPPIHSVALIPIGGRAPWGVLALGAVDPKRWRPDMGTVYLIRLGELVTRALQHFLP